MMTFACTFLGRCRNRACHGAYRASRMNPVTSRSYRRVMVTDSLVRTSTYLKKAQTSRLPPPYVSLYSTHIPNFLNNLKNTPFITKKEYIYNHPGHFCLSQCFNLTKSVHDAPRITLPRPGRNAPHHVNAQSHTDNYRHHIASQNQSIYAHYLSTLEIVVKSDCTIAIKPCKIINRHNVSKG